MGERLKMHRTNWILLLVLLLAFLPALSRADEPTRDVTTPSTDDVDPGTIQDVQVEMPIPGYQPSKYGKKELERDEVKAIRALKKRLEKQEHPLKLLRAFLDLQRKVEKNKEKPSELLLWDLSFGIALVYVDISPLFLPVAEAYFRLALRHASHLDAMKQAGTYYNIACALSLQNRIAEAVEALRNVFEREKKLKVGHFFMMAQSDPTLSAVRGDARYDALMKSLSKKKKPKGTEKKVKP